jgi:type II secretory pathway predicted ATPase ExeA
MDKPQVGFADSLYLTPCLETAVEKVNYVIRKRRGLVCLYGEKSTGKTTLLKYLYSRYVIDERFTAVYLTLAGERRALGFLKQITYPFRVTRRQNVPEQLSEFRQALKSQGKNAVVFLDNAHLLRGEFDFDIVRALLELRKKNGDHLIQVVMAGEYKLHARLAEWPLAAYHILNGFSPNETKRMLDQYATPPVTSTGVEEIFIRAHGIPGRILALISEPV